MSSVLQMAPRAVLMIQAPVIGRVNSEYPSEHHDVERTLLHPADLLCVDETLRTLVEG